MNTPKTFSEADRHKIWQQVFEQSKLQSRLNKEQESLHYAEPSFGTKLRSLTTSLTEWAAAGFKVVTAEQFDQRLDECRQCEYWDPQAMAGTGKCRKCGCSTQAKLRLATAQCPIGKW
jgi:hypothetical protein